MKKLHLDILFMFSLLFLTSCDEWNLKTDQDLVLVGINYSSLYASNITISSFSLNGKISISPNANLISKGICWSKTNNTPTINDSLIIINSSDSININVAGLDNNTTYYVRLFGTNTGGTGYGKVLTIKTLAIPYPIVMDIDGNIYHKIIIGNQTWMVENLRVSHYRNGDAIPSVISCLTWMNLNSGGQCTYNNTSTNDSIYKYGRLYNWFAANDARNIAPTGWHVATKLDWLKLISYVSSTYGDSVVGKSLASKSDWYYSDTNRSIGNNPYTNNSSLFNGIAAGYRNDYDGSYFGRWSNAMWWAADDYDANYAWAIFLSYFKSDISIFTNLKECGYSIRCVQDDVVN